MKKILLITLMLVFVGAGAMALPINDRPSPLDPGPGDAGEYSVQQILDEVTGGTIDAVNDQSNVGVWAPADIGVQSAFKVTYLTGSTGTFGLYNPTTGQTFSLFEKSSSSYDNWTDDSFTPLAMATFFIFNDDLYINNNLVSSSFGSTFGFFWNDGFTEDDKNENDAIYALTYNLPAGLTLNLPAAPGGTTDDNNDWLMFFGDQGSFNGDDFNDLAVLVQDIAPVPEPGTLLLLGAGIAGLAVYRRRSMSK